MKKTERRVPADGNDNEFDAFPMTYPITGHATRGRV